MRILYWNFQVIFNKRWFKLVQNKIGIQDQNLSIERTTLNHQLSQHHLVKNKLQKIIILHNWKTTSANTAQLKLIFIKQIILILNMAISAMKIIINQILSKKWPRRWLPRAIRQRTNILIKKVIISNLQRGYILGGQKLELIGFRFIRPVNLRGLRSWVRRERMRNLCWSCRGRKDSMPT